MTPLEKCFSDGSLETVAPSTDKSAQSLDHAHRLYQEAKNAIEHDSPILAMNGVYFAMFHAARAVLYRDGIREKSHFCLERYLETYVASGKLEKIWVILYARMRERREKSQYHFLPPSSPEEIEAALGQAADFMQVIEQILAER